MLTTEYYQLPAGGRRRPKCPACLRDIADGAVVMILKIPDVSIPFDQRRQYIHIICVRDAMPYEPEVEYIDEVIAGVRDLIRDFSN